MNFALVVACTLLAWICGEHTSRSVVAALGASVLGGFLLSRLRSGRWPNLGRNLAPVAPTLFLLSRAFACATAPPPTRPIYAAALIGAAALAVHLTIAPIVRPWRAGRAAAGLCLSFAALAFAFASADWIYSRFQPVDPYGFVASEGSANRSAYMPDKKLGMIFRRNFRGHFVHPEYHGERIEINNYGYRDRDWPEQPDPETLGILLLGDSTLFGLGVQREGTIAARLEDRLIAQHPGRAYRVYNGGVPGYGPRHELIVLRHLIDILRPRVCIVFFQDTNDLEDCRRQFVQSREGGLHSGRLRSEDLEQAGIFRPPELFTSPTAAGIPPLWTRTYWARYSSLYRDLDQRLMSQIVGLGWAPVNYAYNHEFLRAMHRERDVGIQDEVQLAEDALRSIADECAGHGATFALVRLPGCIQCEPSTFRRMLGELGQDPQQFDRREPGATIVADTQSRGVPVLDLLPVLQIGEGETCPYYFHEGHPNGAGNECIARTAAEFLEKTETLSRALSPSASAAPR